MSGQGDKNDTLCKVKKKYNFRLPGTPGSLKLLLRFIALKLIWLGSSSAQLKKKGE